jgi:hypothetical protein
VLEDRDGTAWNRPADLDVVLRQSFLLGDGTVGPRDRPLGSGQFEKEIEQQVSAKMKREAGEVGDKPAIVAVDDQAGEAVSFAESEAIGGSVSSESQIVLTDPDGGFQPRAQEGRVERFRFPPINPDADRGGGFEKSLGRW